MSPREKKLLIFFATAGFLVLNFLGYGMLKTKRMQADRALADARLKLETAERYQASSEQVADEMDWLDEHEPEPAANQDVQTALQQLCEREAKSCSLTIKSQKPLPSDTTAGLHFHRAKLQISVNGTEESLYRWFDRLNNPQNLRVATVIRVSPNQQDDTKIDCTATVEQWFVPPPA